MIVTLWLTAALAAQQLSLPQDVDAFLARRAQCDHWAGEEPYDAPRASEIEAAVRMLRCDRLDADEAKIRLRYSGNEAVTKALQQDQH